MFLSAFLIFVSCFLVLFFALSSFCAFVRVKSEHKKKNKKFKTVFWYFLIRCVLFVLFGVCKILS